MPEKPDADAARIGLFSVWYESGHSLSRRRIVPLARGKPNHTRDRNHIADEDPLKSVFS
jgi:hypothetical protein